MLNYSEKSLKKAPPNTSESDVHSRISNQLQTYYNEVLTQPLPRRFEDLLKKLDENGGSEGETR
ncbi:NepR family anti-sigma factor [Stappia sp. WLB 29]|uniref:NepR family anti-sigma factor n=1 Tax=Stappia sp. WLB 29 TaxID=2925220 RepID=UPI0020BE2FBA|nr:NepR family anti-sigma factor [Stappia sp. WLB 29]